jgi:hypothetical protein
MEMKMRKPVIVATALVLGSLAIGPALAAGRPGSYGDAHAGAAAAGATVAGGRGGIGGDTYAGLPTEPQAASALGDATIVLAGGLSGGVVL